MKKKNFCSRKHKEPSDKTLLKIYNDCSSKDIAYKKLTREQRERAHYLFHKKCSKN